MAVILALKVDKSRKIRRGSAYMWAVVRRLTEADRGRLITIDDVLGETSGSDKATVRKWLLTLVAAGILERLRPAAQDEPTRFRTLKRPTHLPRLTNDGRPVRGGQDAMWTAMRALKVFSAVELAMAASTEERPVTVETAKTYLRHLRAAGFVRAEREAVSGPCGKPAVLRLVPSMARGPLAPMILRTKLVYDPNVDEVVGEAEAEELTC